MYTIENEYLSATINPRGAELDSLYNKREGQEYMWNGDSRFWGKKSPVLFPIVGTLKDNKYLFQNKEYELGRHGFAREKNFKVSAETPTSITFSLEDDEETLKVYPFQFRFSLVYALNDKSLSVTYLVENKGGSKMYFSVGGHPAFRLPIADGFSYEDYFLLFNEEETTGRWPISADGLIEETPELFLNETDRLPLTKELFEKDAIVLKYLQSNEVELKSDKDTRGFKFSFDGFPFLGIWAAKGADFVCIEPWCGIADGVTGSGKLEDKEGIVELEKGGAFERSWRVTFP
jgi:galactose mutarotase-like enzyme